MVIRFARALLLQKDDCPRYGAGHRCETLSVPGRARSGCHEAAMIRGPRGFQIQRGENMFGRKRKKTSSGRLHARFLKVERLESRQMLNGTVDIQIAPHVGVAAGNLAIVSTDASDESVKIQSTGQVNQYVITGENSTQLTVNEVPVTSPVTLGVSPGVSPSTLDRAATPSTSRVRPSVRPPRPRFTAV